MKYIDAEKLKAEIETRIELLENGDAHPEVMKRVEGVIKGYKETLSIIDSLQQEQSDVDLEEEIKKKRRTILLDVFGLMNGGQCLAVKKFARYFYELGKKGGKI